MTGNNNFKCPEWGKRTNMYEVNLRQYSLSGSFSAFESHLPRLKDLGVEILWFMPITPIGVEGRKMNENELGSYYAVKNYYQVSREFGTMEEWKSLVSKMHDLGFKVIIDWVANHTAPDHPWTTFHPEYYIRDEKGNILPPNSDWTDTRQLDYSNHEMWSAMIDAMIFWVKETDIDGFRCDMAKLVTTDFWFEAINRLRNIKDIIMIAEAEDPGYYQAGFDAQYTWNTFHALSDLYRGHKSLQDILYIMSNNENLGQGLRLTFTSNHDENSWNGTEFDLFGNALQCFSVLNYTINQAIPLIYSGQEASNKKKLSFFTKDVINWENTDLQPFYTSLNRLRSIHAAFNIDAHFELVNTGNTAIYAYTREQEFDKVLILLNMSSNHQSFQFYDDRIKGKVLNYFTNESLELNTNQFLNLEGWGYFIFIYTTI